MIVTSTDGSPLTVASEGTGPGVVLIHGGGVSIADYRRLRSRLAVSFTVHAFDRRGRGDAPPIRATDDFSTDLGDIRSVLEATGSSMLFGHSVGGYFTMAAARELPVTALAIYDPAVFVDDLFPTAFLPDFFEAVARGDDVDALAIATKGLGNPGASLPRPVRKAMIGAFMRTPIGRRMAELLPTVVREDRLALEGAGPAAVYSGVAARCLFIAGSRSPRYYGPICDRLAAVVPEGRSATLAHAAHDAPNIAPAALVEMLASHFAQPTPDSRITNS